MFQQLTIGLDTHFYKKNISCIWDKIISVFFCFFKWKTLFQTKKIILNGTKIKETYDCKEKMRPGAMRNADLYLWNSFQSPCITTTNLNCGPNCDYLHSSQNSSHSNWQLTESQDEILGWYHSMVLFGSILITAPIRLWALHTDYLSMK